MKQKKVLIIDDETEFSEMLALRLEANNYSVLTAPDGEGGLAVAKAEKPDIILLDVMLPGLAGFEVLRRLKRQPETDSVPVIMLTAKGESKSIFKAQDGRAVDYFIKPCDSRELLALLKRYA